MLGVTQTTIFSGSMWKNEHDDEHVTTHSHDFSLSVYLSFQELLDYLVQLLGSENDKVRALAENIGLFQQGADLTLSAPPLQPNSTIPDTSSQSTTTTTTPKKAAAAPTTKTVEPQKPTPQPKHTHKKKKQSTQPRTAKTPPRRQTNTPSNPTPAEASPKPPQTNHNKSSKNKTTTSIVLPKKSRPTRGEPKFVCGCFGTFHKPLTNCLFCGRIACEKEGYTYCAFCGYMVERSPPGSSSTADKHKERLLRFDREHARRTFVLDDQADFFTTQQARNWVGSEEERKAMEEKEEEQLLASRQRPKMQLQIDL